MPVMCLREVNQGPPGHAFFCGITPRLRKHISTFWIVGASVGSILHAMLTSRIRGGRIPSSNLSKEASVVVSLRYLIPLFRAVSLVAFTCLAIAGSNPVIAQESTPQSVLGEDPNASCATSRLRIGDLESVDGTSAAGVERAVEEAQRWQPDARLYTLRLGCPLLTTGVQWEGVFFSETAQAYYSTDTGRIEAVNDAPETIPTLDPSNVSMKEVYRSLIRAGFSDDLQLTAQGGVTIRQSTQTHPFGPPAAPRDGVYAHLAIEVDGQITDVWVSTMDGTIYRYSN
jgi:hypothetical protein